MRTYHFTYVFALFFCFSLGAQNFEDNFADGNFTANPPWSGDVGEFIVNASNQLQLSAAAAGSYYLSSPASLQDTATWEFWMRINTAPSNNNRARVYLMANVADLSGNVDGYYVQAGENGGDDPIEIYAQTGATRTVVYRSPNLGTVANNPAIARLRITRSTAGAWDVFADYSGGANLVFDGSFTDNTHSRGNFLGVWVASTAANTNNYFFDDFFASPLFVDTDPPLLDSALAVSGTEVRVFFNEPLGAASANTASNYSLNNGATVLSAQIDAGNPAQVLLTTSALVSQTTYTLTATGVQDLAGNALTSANTSFTYLFIEDAAPGDIIFNELMPDPNPAVNTLPEHEYIELYNRSNKLIDLSTLIYRDASDRSLPALVLFPGDYAVFVPSAALADFAGTPNLYPINNLSLTNAGRAITLRRASDGLMIDSLFYTLDWYQDASKGNGGWSLELINPADLCKGRFNWRASEDPNGGTPGLQNSIFDNTPDLQAPNLLSSRFLSPTEIELLFDESLDPASASNLANYQLTGGLSISAANFFAPDTVRLSLGSAMLDQVSYSVTVQGLADCLGNAIAAPGQTENFIFYDIQPAARQDIILNELMVRPRPVRGLEDAEYAELYNRSNKVFEIEGMTLSHQSLTASTINTVTLPNYILLPGEYLLLHRKTDDALFQNCINCVGVPSMFTFNQTAATLILRRGDGSVVDSIVYTNQWYNDTERNSGGYSMELINPNDLCKEGTNWRASLDPRGGTPASENSVFSNIPDTLPPGVLEVRPTDSYELLIFFDEEPNAAALQTTSYTVSGGLTVLAAQDMGNMRILLTLDANMQDQLTYTLTINGVGDCLGNSLQNANFNFLYIETQAAERYDIIINEIMSNPNPPVGLPNLEWIELYNRSEKVINLNDFQLFDNSSTVGQFPYHLLFPGDYLIVCAARDTAILAVYGSVLGIQSMPTLNVGGDDLVIRSSQNRVIDAVSYLQSWYGSSSKANGGWTLERINPNRPCEGFRNWSASVNTTGGTPGRENSLLQTQPDETPIDAIRAFPERPDTIRIFFSEAAEAASAADASNYSIDNGLSVLSAQLEEPGFTTVLLALDAPLEPGIIYTVTMSSALSDCVGNPISLRNSVRVALPVAYTEKDLRINEVLYHPVVGGSDFVELYNPSGKVVNAADLLFANTDVPGGNINQTQQVTGPFLIFPGDYVAFGPNRLQIIEQYQTPNPDYVVENRLPTYSSGDGTVVLYGRAGLNFIMLDSFVYDDAYHNRLLRDRRGVSLERIDLNAETNNANNWHSGASATNYGTPAYQNSAARDNALNEGDWLQIADPRFSPDGDAFEDFLLINYNIEESGFALNLNIYDARGVLVRQLVQGEILALEGQYIWDGSNDLGQRAPVGIYIVSAEIYTATGTRRKAKKTVVLAGQLGN